MKTYVYVFLVGVLFGSILVEDLYNKPVNV